MAHKKGVGSSKNGRESESKRLGVKIYGGQFAKAGNILIRQHNTTHNPGENVGMGKDHTLFALIDGTVVFKKKLKNRSYVSVQPIVEVDVAVAEAPEVKAPKATVKPVAKETKTEVAVEVAEVKAPKADIKPVAKETKAKVAVEVAEADDLKKIEGIGPKIAEIFNAAGISTFADLAGTSVEKLSEILVDVGSSYASKNPGTWPEQAKLAAEGNWDVLKDLQEKLKGGLEK